MTDSWAVTWFGRGYLTAYLPAAWRTGTLPSRSTERSWSSRSRRTTRSRKRSTALAAAGFSKDKPLKFALLGGSDNGFSRTEAEIHQSQINRFGQGVVQITKLDLYDLATRNQVLAQGNFDYMSANAVAGAAL